MNEIAKNSAVLPTQTHRFAWNLAAALESAGAVVSLVSALPIPNYPEYPKIIIRSGVVDQGQIQGVTLGFLNLLILKHATRFLQCLRVGMRYIRRRRAKFIVVHGVHSPFLVFARLIKRLLRLRIVLVMTDPPGVVRAVDGSISRMLKRLDRRLLQSLASGFDGVICLTPALAADFAPNVPCLILEGFANPELAEVAQITSSTSGGLRVAYAGGISAEYGVENLVLAFKSIDDPHARLSIYGKGPLDDWVRKQSECDARISHCGLLAHDSLMSQLRQSSILVNPRPSAQGFVRYSFPSKVLEYLTLGVPMVTTRLEGLSADYLRFAQVAEGDSVSALAGAIRSVISEYGSALDRARRGQEYVISEKSVEAQGLKISQFLADL
ncbi:glycosyltransferase [Arthrobacter sp. RT-1]|uniref:glycosyltransferase n=1 Tax=Arthrobacter sp. RT-1 TaxID=2292263 RepID=UPI0015F1BBD9|nr:glycosyltransferase [Arthrobacter sp. RT-1]